MTPATTLDLDGIIGWDVTAAEVRAALAEAAGPVTLRINSPGGDVHEGVAIANALRAHRREGHEVRGVITGLAASMASYIAMFTDQLEVEDNAILMIHNPWSLAMGDYRVMRKAAGILGSLRDLLARAYADKSGQPPPDILADMDAESWYFGEEIVAAGYADALVPAGDGPDNPGEALALAQSTFSAMRLKLKEREADSAYLDRMAALLPTLYPSAAPAAINPELPMQTPKPRAEAEPSAPVEPIAPDANPDEDKVATVVAAPGDSDGAPPEPVDVEAIRAAAVAEERARVAAISELCASVNQSARAAGYIASGASLEQARAALIKVWAESAGPEIRSQAPAGQPTANLATLHRTLLHQIATPGGGHGPSH